MQNFDRNKLEEIIKKDNRFILADINLSKGTKDYDTIWRGFGSKREIRGPRFIQFPKEETLEIWGKLGYNVIVFDQQTHLQWFEKGCGKGLFHASFIEEWFPSVLKPLPSINSDKYGGFFDENTEIGKILARKRLNKTERKKLFEEFGDSCYICKSTKNLTVHHIRERQFGGGTEKLNSVVLCQECHTKINKKEIDGFTLHSLRYREGHWQNRSNV